MRSWRRCCRDDEIHEVHDSYRTRRPSAVGGLMSKGLECPTCGDIVEEASARFCGRCGSALETPKGSRGRSPSDDDPGNGVQEETPLLSRRGLIAGGAGLFIGAVAGVMGARHLSSAGRARVDPTEELPEATFEAGNAREMIERIRSGGPVPFPRESPRVAVTIWDPTAQAGGRTAREIYGEQGQHHPVLEDTGLVVLSLWSTHLGCKVSYCETSGWFEDPCHGSKWNSWGEWTSGPAPRGLDRFGSSIRSDGTLIVDLAAHQVGPDRELRFGPSQPSGPLCIDV